MNNPPFIHKLSDVIDEYIPDGYGYMLIIGPYAHGAGQSVTCVTTFARESAIDLAKEFIEKSEEQEEE